MTQQENRRRRLNEVFQNVVNCSKAGISCSRKKLISAFEVDFGQRAKTTNEYIEALIAAGKIKQIQDELWLCDEQQKLIEEIEKTI